MHLFTEQFPMRAECVIMFILKRSKLYFIWEFSFSKFGFLTKARYPSLPIFIHNLGGE